MLMIAMMSYYIVLLARNVILKCLTDYPQFIIIVYKTFMNTSFVYLA